MGSPYVGEIRIFAGNFAPSGWFLCQGQLLPISEYDVLFNLIGTTYGGDGVSTFALPDLQGRVPVHVGQGPGSSYQLGESGGTEAVTLTAAQMPAHAHALQASQDAAQATAGPDGSVPADAGANAIYGSATPGVGLDTSAVVAGGGGQPHGNVAPFLCVNFIISAFGIYPTQS